jgi:hypothetical protein
MALVYCAAASTQSALSKRLVWRSVARFQVVASQLIITKAVPEDAFKWVLYPGTCIPLRRQCCCYQTLRLLHWLRPSPITYLPCRIAHG